MAFYFRRIVEFPHYQERIHQVVENPCFLFQHDTKQILKFGEEDVLEAELASYSSDSSLELHSLPHDQNIIDQVYNTRKLGNWFSK